MRQSGRSSRAPRDTRRSSGSAPRSVSRSPEIGGDQIEGRRAVFEALRANRRRVREIWFDSGLERTGIVSEIAHLALQRGVPLIEVASSRFDRTARSDSSQGVVAFADRLIDISLADLVRSSGKVPQVVVLDHVTDPRNLGAILRSAEVAGFEGVVLSERRSTKVTPTVAKASAGAIEYLSFAMVPGIPAALEELKSLGLWVVGLEPSAERLIYDVELLKEPLALVLGSEGRGLSRLVRERCDALAGIPQYGRVDSLNVSAAATVAFYEVAKRRRE